MAPTAVNTPDDLAGALLKGANRLQDIGRSDKLFAAVVIDEPHRALVVHRQTGASSPLYPATERGARVVFASALLTRTQTDRTMTALLQHRPDLDRQGVQLQAVESDGVGPVVAHVSRPDAAAAALLRRYAPYGPGSVSVRGTLVIRPAAAPARKWSGDAFPDRPT